MKSGLARIKNKILIPVSSTGKQCSNYEEAFEQRSVPGHQFQEKGE